MPARRHRPSRANLPAPLLPGSGLRSLRFRGSPAPGIHRRLLSLLLVFAVFLLGPGAGCALRKEGGAVVRGVHFQGNGSITEGTSDFHLRKAMAQQASPWTAFILPWVEAEPLDREALARDAWRIEVWYAHRGFFNARFKGWSIVEKRPEGRRRRNGRQRPRVVQLVGTLDQGPPTTVREVTFEGLDRRFEPILAFVRQNGAMQAGGRFELEALEETREMLRYRLRQQSFAVASVRSEVHVYPDEQAADVHFVAETGPACTFGEVTVHGHETVPEVLIRDEVTIEPGNSFKASTLAETRRRLFGLGTFSVVQVKPGAPRPPGREGATQEGGSDSGQPPEEARGGDSGSVVPVDIQLSESSFRRLRAGAGFGIESGEQEAHVSVDFRNTNLAHRLLLLDLDAEVGYATRASYEEIAEGDLSQNAAPVADVGLRFEYPRVFGRRWRWIQDLDYELGIESDYQYSSPTFNPSLVFSATDHLAFTIGYRLRYFDYLEVDLDTDAIEDSVLGLDFTDPYFLGIFEPKVVWDRRDDVLFTHRGLYVSGGLGLAGGGLAPDFRSAGVGEFNFVRASADLRNYITLAPPPRPRWLRRAWRQLNRRLGLGRKPVLAMRIAGGAAFPYGDLDHAKVPYAERFYIGGGSTVRGWVSEHLGPWLCETEADDGSVAYDTMAPGAACADPIPIGGRLASYGSVELRTPVAWGMGLVGFFDLGMAWDDPSDFQEIPPLAAAGPGFRYASPVGPVRLDLGFRLDDNPYFENEPRWNLHFSLSEAF